jgi:large subunit ribosomal protein L30
MAYLVVRIRGTVNIPYWANNTLDNLNLDKRFRATVIPETPQSLGMLRKVKDIVAWTSADAVIIKELLEKRGKRTGFKPITNSDLPEGYNSIEELASAIADDKLSLSKIRSIKPWFALNSPRGGFKRKTKTQYSQEGVLGEDKDLTDIVKRML